ncbi:unnamed protein product, partial [Adineta steineri]
VGTSKARRRKNKARATTPPPSSARSSGQIEGILANKDEKSPITNRPQPMPHPKLAIMIPKDEVELAKEHQQHAKSAVKSSQPLNKQNVAAAVAAPPASVKKPTPSSTNANQGAQKQQQQQEQPFTTVVGKGHKSVPPPSQQQQQQPKSVNTTSSTSSVVPTPSVQQQAPVQQHEQLAQRQAPVQQREQLAQRQAPGQQREQLAQRQAPGQQREQLAQRQPPRQQKEAPVQLNGFKTPSVAVKQPTVVTPTVASASPTKLADIVKTLPTSQTVVTELMSALDAFPLSTDELDIIMHKIANKQTVLKQDWNKLQFGHKVDPQAHIGQALDESTRAYEQG